MSRIILLVGAIIVGGLLLLSVLSKKSETLVDGKSSNSENVTGSEKKNGFGIIDATKPVDSFDKKINTPSMVDTGPERDLESLMIETEMGMVPTASLNLPPMEIMETPKDLPLDMGTPSSEMDLGELPKRGFIDPKDMVMPGEE